MIKEGSICLLIFLDMWSVSVFKGLNFTNQASAPITIFLRSVLRVSAATSGLLIIMKRLVSSAKRRMLDPVSVTISFIKKIRKDVVQGLILEELLSWYNTILNLLPVRQHVVSTIKINRKPCNSSPEIPVDLSLWRGHEEDRHAKHGQKLYLFHKTNSPKLHSQHQVPGKMYYKESELVSSRVLRYETRLKKI